MQAITTQWCWAIAAPNVHFYANPASPTITLALHVESPLPVYWPPGVGAGQSALTTTVRHRGQTIALDGHDLGVVEAHYNIPPASPPNLLLAVIIPFASRQVLFSTS